MTRVALALLCLLTAGCGWLAQRDPAAAEYVLAADGCMRRFPDAAPEARACVRAERARLHPDGGAP